MSPFSVIFLTLAVCGAISGGAFAVASGLIVAFLIELSLVWSRSDNASA